MLIYIKNATIYRFAPNPIIQEVQMNVVLMSPTNSFNESKWNELNKALTCLKMVNPNIVLNLKTTVFGGKKVQVRLKWKITGVFRQQRTE